MLWVKSRLSWYTQYAAPPARPAPKDKSVPSAMRVSHPGLRRGPAARGGDSAGEKAPLSAKGVPGNDVDGGDPAALEDVPSALLIVLAYS